MHFPQGTSRPVGVYQNDDGSWTFHCEQRFCYKLIRDNDEATIRDIAANHGCPYSAGETTYSWSVQVMHLNKMWEELDATLDRIMALRAKQAEAGVQSFEDANQLALPLAEAQAYARGLAFSLAIWMPPHYTTTEEVTREAVVRRKARLAGETHVTGGLHKRYMAGTAGRAETDPLRQRPAVPAMETSWAEKAAADMDPKRAASIKAAVEAGMVTAVEAASMYKLDIKVIEAVLKT